MRYNTCQICGLNKLDKDNKFRRFCSRECRYKSQIGKPANNKGKPTSLEARKRQSEARLKYYANGGEPWNKGKPFYSIQGKNHPNWNGGISPLRAKEAGGYLYKNWKRNIFKRDSFKCVKCGSPKNIQADHIKMYACFPHLKYDISNGQTLCKLCHNEKTRKELSWYFPMVRAIRELEQEGKIKRHKEIINGVEITSGFSYIYDSTSKNN